MWCLGPGRAGGLGTRHWGIGGVKKRARCLAGVEDEGGGAGRCGLGGGSWCQRWVGTAGELREPVWGSVDRRPGGPSRKGAQELCMWRKVGKTLTGNAWRLPLPPNGPGAKCSLVLSELGAPRTGKMQPPEALPGAPPATSLGTSRGLRLQASQPGLHLTGPSRTENPSSGFIEQAGPLPQPLGPQNFEQNCRLLTVGGLWEPPSARATGSELSPGQEPFAQ